MEKKFYWIKLKKDFYQDNNAIDFLLSQKNGSDYVVIYQMLALLTTNSNGRLESIMGEMIIPFNIEKISRELKYFNIDTITIALELFKKLGLIYEDFNNCLILSKYNDLVGYESSSAERVRQYRNKKALHCNNDVTKCNVTKKQLSNNNVTQEKDIDIEIDKDIENIYKSTLDKNDKIDKNDKTILNNSKLVYSKNPFVNYLQKEKYITELDLIHVHPLEIYFEELFKGYDLDKNKQAYSERFRNVMIATKYLVECYKHRDAQEPIEDLYSYTVKAIGTSLNKDYSNKELGKLWGLNQKI